jgi:hypothetical protein
MSNKYTNKSLFHQKMNAQNVAFKSLLVIFIVLFGVTKHFFYSNSNLHDDSDHHRRHVPSQTINIPHGLDLATRFWAHVHHHQQSHLSSSSSNVTNINETVAVASSLCFDMRDTNLVDDFHHIFRAAKKLAATLRSIATSHLYSNRTLPLVMLIVDRDEIVTQKEILFLKTVGWDHIIMVPTNYFTNHLHCDTYFSLDRLFTWNLTQYQAILYIDVMSLVVQNLDPIFTQYLPLLQQSHTKSVAMVPVTDSDTTFNTAVVLLQPNQVEFQKLLQCACNLNVCFRGRIYPMSPTFNVRIGTQVSDVFFKLNLSKFSDSAILHYVFRPWSGNECKLARATALCTLWSIF